MRQKGQYKYERIVKTPTRGSQEVGILIKGLNFSKDAEKVEKENLSTCDGFICYTGVLRKDWNVIDSANVACDNITITAAASVETCSA